MRFAVRLNGLDGRRLSAAAQRLVVRRRIAIEEESLRGAARHTGFDADLPDIGDEAVRSSAEDAGG